MSIGAEKQPYQHQDEINFTRQRRDRAGTMKLVKRPNPIFGD